MVTTDQSVEKAINHQIEIITHMISMCCILLIIHKLLN